MGYSLIDFNNQRNVTIFIDLAQKGSLATLLKKSQKGLLEDIFDNTKKQIILVGIARGMMILHNQKVIHSDLKPSNILLDNEYHPHITDFGLSKFYENVRSTIQSQQCGTSIYMAPEIIEGNRYNGKVDVFPLFQSGGNKLIESCWAKDPKKRPTFEEIFKKLGYNVDDFLYNIYDDVNDNDVNNEENYYLEDVDDIDNEKSINDLIEKLINPIIKANEEFKKELTELRSENVKTKNENVKTINKNIEIKKDLTSLQNENEETLDENEVAKDENEETLDENEEAKDENEETLDENEEAKDENDENDDIKNDRTGLRKENDELVKEEEKEQDTSNEEKQEAQNETQSATRVHKITRIKI